MGGVERSLLRELLHSVQSGEDECTLLSGSPCVRFRVVTVKKGEYNGCTQDIVDNEHELRSQMHYSHLIGFMKETSCKESLIPTANDETSNVRAIHALELVRRLFKVPVFNDDASSNDGAYTKATIHQLCSVTEDRTNFPDVLLAVDGGANSNYVRLLLISEQGPLSDDFSLWHLVTYNRAVIASNLQKLLFIIYQIIHALHKCLEIGVIPNPLQLDDFLVDASGWTLFKPFSSVYGSGELSRTPSVEATPIRHVTASPETVPSLTKEPLWKSTDAWCHGRISNFDYLIVLNHFAGRISGQPHNHPIFPWVCDFSLAEGGWRDLTKTKFRLNKGDRQLDQCFQCASVVAPHHLPELLSDHAFYLYNARRLSKQLLCSHIRSQWVPEEYPSSMRRLYECTPDESIPEFYSDSSIFVSTHDDMCDLALPSWCETIDDFLRWHRAMLECEWVSQRLNCWIDLAFGYKLTGRAAVNAKNVHLSMVPDPSSRLRNYGAVQLFRTPHPRKHFSNDTLSTMDEAVDFVMNPMYELSQRCLDENSTDDNDFGLVELARGIVQKKQSLPTAELMRSLGVLITEMLFPQQFSSLPRRCKLQLRYEQAKAVVSSSGSLIPRVLRRSLQILLGDDQHLLNSLQNITTPGLLLQPLFCVFHFPNYMPVLHNRLTQSFALQRHRLRLVALHGSVSDADGLADEEVRFLSQLTAQLRKDPESTELLCGFVCSSLARRSTAVTAAWALFNPLSQLLGQMRSGQRLLPLLLQLYDVEQPCSRRFFKLYHRTFLLQLSVRLGTRVFLDNFVPLLIEAAAGERDCRTFDSELRYLQRAFYGVEENSTEEGNEASPRGHHKPASTANGDLEQTSATMFDLDLTDRPSSVINDSTDSALMPLSSATAEGDEDRKPSDVASTVAQESLVWLAHRLGPVLCARYITSGLLKMLAVCYSGDKLRIISGEGIDTEVSGDLFCCNTLDCLLEIATVYGSSFILSHYFPYCADLISQCNRRLSASTEGGTIGCVALLEACCPFLSDKQLMDCLQEPIVDSVIFPAVRLASSLKFSFANVLTRKLLIWKCVRILHMLGCRVGSDNFKRHMSAPLQRLLCTYDLLYELADGGVAVEKPDGDAELRLVFSPELVSMLYHMFSGLCGKRYFQLGLPNSDLILALMSFDRGDRRSAAFGRTMGGSEDDDASSVSSLFTGNRLSVSFTDDPLPSYIPTDDAVSERALGSSQRHLIGNWLGHWENSLGKNGTTDSYSFNQMPLLTFTGHTGAVKRLTALENENSFISGSQDKTMKLWSLQSFGGGSEKMEAKWTYKAHRKPIQDLSFINSIRLVASADAAVLHIWDPFIGSTLREFDLTSPSVASSGSDTGSHAVQFLRSFNSPSNLLLVVGADPLLRFVDVRCSKWVHEFKSACSSQCGTVRSVAVCSGGQPSVAVGFSSGQLSTVDLRTGGILDSCKYADSDVNLMESANDNGDVLFWQGGDSAISKTNVLSLASSHRVTNSIENLNCFVRFDDYVLCGVGGGKLKIFKKYKDAQSQTPQCAEFKIRTESFTGSANSISVLPLNRVVLLGSSTGVIQLLC